jgi:hypothetical protein
MASLLSARVERAQRVAYSPCAIPSEALEQHKLNRLLELRAVIDAMRCEREARDPLLSWVKERERAENA